MFRFLIAVALVVLPHYAIAQTMQKFMTPQSLQISLVQGTQTPVALKIVSTTSVTSCAEVGPLESTISLDRNFVDIDTGGYTVTQKQRGTCAAGIKYASTTVDLSPEEFKQYEVTQLRLWSGPRMDAYNVKITDTAFTLTPPSMTKFFKPADGNSLTFPLSGMSTTTSSDDLKPFEETVKIEGSEKTSVENTVLVRVEGYPDSDVEAQLTALMESRGLHPTEAIRKEPGRVNIVRAVDTGGQFAMQAKYNGPVLLGRIGSREPLDNTAIGGPSQQTFDVFVSLP